MDAEKVADHDRRQVGDRFHHRGVTRPDDRQVVATHQLAARFHVSGRFGGLPANRYFGLSGSCRTMFGTAARRSVAAAASELDTVCLVVAAACSGPIVAYAVARLLAPALRAPGPVGGFLASANLGAATRLFSSASTPLVLTVGLSCTLIFGSPTIDHATTQQQVAALTGQLAITSARPGLPAAALADTRATPGMRSAVALTSTTLGPSLGAPDTIAAQILAGGRVAA
jgi:hypothetical protein